MAVSSGSSDTVMGEVTKVAGLLADADYHEIRVQHEVDSLPMARESGESVLCPVCMPFL